MIAVVQACIWHTVVQREYKVAMRLKIPDVYICLQQECIAKAFLTLF